MDYTDFAKNDTKTLLRAIVIGAVGLALSNIWNASITQIINTVYPASELDKEQNKYERIAAYIIYAIGITILAIGAIKLVFV